MQFPDLSYENELWQQGYTVIGIDEVGRGCLAGPITIGAAIINPQQNSHLLNTGINDSKLLSAQKREKLSEFLKKNLFAYTVQSSDVQTINEKGIVTAFKLAVQKAIIHLSDLLPKHHKLFLLIDAFTIKDLPEISLEFQKGIIKGDQKSISIASASILAKVERDRLMKQFGESVPHYGWDVNKGYATKKHRDAITTHGVHSLHRTLFIRNIVKSI